MWYKHYFKNLLYNKLPSTKLPRISNSTKSSEGLLLNKTKPIGKPKTGDMFPEVTKPSTPSELQIVPVLAICLACNLNFFKCLCCFEFICSSIVSLPN